MSIGVSNRPAVIDWQAEVEAWRESGLSMSAYCRQHTLVMHQFSYYKRKLETPSTAIAVSGFSQVAVLNASSSDGLIVRLVNGLSIAGINQQNLPLVVSLARALS